MAALPQIRRKFTVEEYLVIERAADTRSEFLDGEIYAMAGASKSHTTLNDNLTTKWAPEAKGYALLGMSQNMKVPAGTGHLYAYPDYLIVCGEQIYKDDQQDVLQTPWSYSRYCLLQQNYTIAERSSISTNRSVPFENMC